MTSKTRTLSLGRPGIALRSRQGISWRFLGLRVGTARRREGEGILMDQLVTDQLVMLAVSEKSTRLDAEARCAHFRALEQLGKAAAEEGNARRADGRPPRPSCR